MWVGCPDNSSSKTAISITDVPEDSFPGRHINGKMPLTKKSRTVLRHVLGCQANFSKHSQTKSAQCGLWPLTAETLGCFFWFFFSSFVSIVSFRFSLSFLLIPQNPQIATQCSKSVSNVRHSNGPWIHDKDTKRIHRLFSGGNQGFFLPWNGECKSASEMSLDH